MYEHDGGTGASRHIMDARTVHVCKIMAKTVKAIDGINNVFLALIVPTE